MLQYSLLFSVDKNGWGVRSGNAPQESSIGLVKKSNAAAYWDNKTTELDIPDIMEVDAPI